MEINELVTKNLRAIRSASGVTQKLIADKAGVSTQTIRDIEAGRRGPSLDLLGKIALALGVPSSSMLEDKEPTIQTQKPTIKILPSKLMQKLASIPDDVYEAIFEAGELNDQDWSFIKSIAKNAKTRNESKKEKDNGSAI